MREAVVGSPRKKPANEQVKERAHAHRGGARSHREGKAALSALDVLGAVPSFGESVFRIGRLVRRGHDPVPQDEVLGSVGPKKGIVDCHGSGSRKE